MDWKCPNCDREIAGSGDTCPHCGVRTPRDSWAFKCAWLGKVIASNEHGAFAFNKSTGQLWLATPETAFEINTKELGSDGNVAIDRLFKIWTAKCKGDCPLTFESLAAMVTLAEPLIQSRTHELIDRLPKMTDASQIADILIEGVHGKQNEVIWAAHKRLKEIDHVRASELELFMPNTLVKRSPLAKKPARVSPNVVQIIELLNEVKAYTPYHGLHVIMSSESEAETIRSLSNEEIKQATGVLRQLQTEIHTIRKWNESRMRANQMRADQEGKHGYSARFIAMLMSRFQQLEDAVESALAKPPEKIKHEGILVIGGCVSLASLVIAFVVLLNPGGEIDYSTRCRLGWIFMSIGVVASFVVLLTRLRDASKIKTT